MKLARTIVPWHSPSPPIVFPFLKNRRRRQIRAIPFPNQWKDITRWSVSYYPRLSKGEIEKLHGLIQILIAEKRWEGCDGLTVRDEMRVTIAGQAALMLLGIDDYFFDRVRTILIYPNPIRRQYGGLLSNHIIDEPTTVSGEAWHAGSVVLSWANVQQDVGNPHNGHNVVIHEFAHQLDRIDGEMGGSPPLPNNGERQRWEQICGREFAQLKQAASERRATFLDHYGATNRAEFFAVASELFFERPFEFEQHHRDLFGLLKSFYQSDPRNWASRA